jgi:hypothetical protein
VATGVLHAPTGIKTAANTVDARVGPDAHAQWQVPPVDLGALAAADGHG